MENPLLILKNKISELTEMQRKVADYIIQNPSDVAFLTIDQLARAVETSTTTIMRLTFSLGYSGYAEFQKGLQEILRHKAAPHTRLEVSLRDQDHNDLWINSAENAINGIKLAVEMIPKDTLDKTLDMICSANRIYCTSVRSGLPVAQYLTHGINRTLGNCKLIVADHSDWLDDVINFSSSDLVIAVSFPRYANRVIEFISNAKENNAKVISITDNYSSPLVKYSDIILPCNAKSLSYHNSIIPAVFVTDYLLSAVARKYPEETRKRLDKINSIYLDMNYHST